MGDSQQAAIERKRRRKTERLGKTGRNWGRRRETERESRETTRRRKTERQRDTESGKET